MISGEGIESAELEPTSAEFDICISSESTDIGSHHLEAKHLIVEVISNWSSQILPAGIVIASPVETIFAWAEGWASGDDERFQVFALEEEVGCVGLEEGAVGMHVGFADVAIVSSVEGNGVAFDLIWSWLVGQILRVVEDGRLASSFTCTIAEVSQLIHIKPNTTELYLFIEIVEHILPILRSIGMEEINEGSRSWPNFTHIWFFSTGIPNVDIPFQTFLIGASTIFDTGVDNRNVSVSLKNLVHLIEWESFLIDCEILVVDHVIDIVPDGIKRNAVLFVVE